MNYRLDNCFFIFIGCRKRTGKDTVAKMLLEYGRANGIDIFKESCISHARRTMIDLIPQLKNTDDKDKKTINGRSYREILIKLVDPILKIDELAFAKNLLKSIEEFHEENFRDFQVFVVPDIRRKSEVDFFRNQLKDKSYFVCVDKNIQKDNNAYGEGFLDDYNWDMIINNNGTLEDLEKSVIPLINIIHDTNELQKTKNLV